VAAAVMAAAAAEREARVEEEKARADPERAVCVAGGRQPTTLFVSS
jgi:hypothetical protein